MLKCRQEHVVTHFGGKGLVFFVFMAFQGDSIYWVEVEKVVPNPFQPRREFDQNKLQELADSIRMYGVLQPLTVTRKEIQREDGTFYSEYELIAGERRLRASRLAQVSQVPVIIREGEQSEQEKLELAIIENLQREDLNAVDRALAFQQLSEMFGLSHSQVAQKMGRSREYVSNSIRLLGLPSHMLDALRMAKLSEGHARTLLMLNDRKEEQEVVFQEILLKKLSVREVERIARKIATDKIRKSRPDEFDVHLIEMEKQFTETLGTRVQIQKTDFGGKLTIDYFSTDDLDMLLSRVKQEYHAAQAGQLMSSAPVEAAAISQATPLQIIEPAPQNFADTIIPEALFIPEVADEIAEDTIIEPEEDDSDLYSINSFTV
jgi:ParB family transcriptional regulator, chromosome partitioning protein